MSNNNEYVDFEFELIDDGSNGNSNRVPQYAESKPPENKPRKKRSGAMRFVALALVCAVAGGAGGSAVTAYLMQSQSTVPAMSETSIAAENADEPASEVVINNVVHTNKGDKSLTPQEVYYEYVDAVVGINVSGTSLNVFGQISEFAASGSGFIISEDGYIVTNQHVISGASTVDVALYDGSTYEAMVIGSDASNDVALLKINATGLKFVSIGNSDEITVGDQVAAIGNPLGELTFSLTAGYISALDRAINTDGTPINMLQTDAAINSGNSGGPLFDMNGNVIGITTAKYSGSTASGTTIEGIGFAIPINDVMSIVNDLKAYGYVTGQAYLGISVKDLDATTAAYYSLPVGVYVAEVTADSCADAAGVQSGDIITGIGDIKVEAYADLTAALKKFAAGDATTLEIYRAGQELTLEITLDEKLPAAPTEEPAAENAEEQPSVDEQPNYGYERPQEGEGYPINPFEYFFGNGN